MLGSDDVRFTRNRAGPLEARISDELLKEVVADLPPRKRFAVGRPEVFFRSDASRELLIQRSDVVRVAQLIERAGDVGGVGRDSQTGDRPWLIRLGRKGGGGGSQAQAGAEKTTEH